MSFSKIKIAISYLSIYLLGLFVYLGSGFSVSWEGYGFRNEFSTLRLFFSLLIILSFINFFSLRHNFSVIAIHAVFLLIFIPSFILYVASGLSNYFIFLTILAFLVLSIGSKIIPFLIPNFNLPSFPIFIIYKISALMIVATITAVIYFTGLKYLNFNIWEVYNFRSDIEASLPHFMTYLINWTAKVFCPIFMVFSLSRQKYANAACAVCASVIVFGLTAHKSVLLFTVLAAFVYFITIFYIKRPRLLKIILLSIFIASFIVSFIEFYISNRSGEQFGFIGTLFFRRCLLIPSLLNSFYIETFGVVEDFSWFSDKMFTFSLIENPLDTSISHVIGQRYYKPDTSANAGWIGSGFAQFGVFGIFIYSMCLAFYFSLANIASKRWGMPITTGVLVVPVLVMLTSSDFFTSLSTHGGLISLLILLIFSPSKVNLELREKVS